MSELNLVVDASQITAAERGQQRVKVAVQQSTGVKSQIVSVEGGSAKVRFDVDPKEAAAIAVGPADATDEDIFHLETLTASVSPNQWAAGQASLDLASLVISPNWWGGWLRWCRDFVITGRVVCADGSPVPGAEVRAYDLSFFWWWLSQSQVGLAATTDANGHFTIKFRWCCGWLPWWWWRLREWRLEPLLVEKINPILKINPTLKFPKPSPVPTLQFAQSLGATPVPPAAPPMTRGTRLPSISVRQPLSGLSAVGAGALRAKPIDPTVIPTLRDGLLSKLPHVPELERLRIWPWYPWAPWTDCTPDIIFRATQDCGNGVKVILSENVFQTRWDIPTNLNVNLVAKDACCIPQQPPPPPGDCVVLTGICGDPGITLLNIGRTGVTAGYASPGSADQPFSETLTMVGQFGSAAQADYYEVEIATHSDLPHAAGDWSPVPATILLDFSRNYFDATQPPGPLQFPPPVPFLVKTFGTRHVYESRHHYEVNHPPANWGNAFSGRAWYENVNELVYLQSLNTLADGAYDFRIVGYQALSGGPDPGPDPTTRKVMDGCGNNPDNNLFVLRFDNRTPFVPIPGTVHLPTSEPDCGITNVKIGGTSVGACKTQQLLQGQPLEVDFFVTDPDGHLSYYELTAEHGLGASKNLLSTAEVGTLTLTGAGSAKAGPTYADAITQGAVRPSWPGGSITLVVNDASRVFTETCCYLIRLTVWKRNIANCGSPAYYNQFHYTFTVIV